MEGFNSDAIVPPAFDIDQTLDDLAYRVERMREVRTVLGNHPDLEAPVMILQMHELAVVADGVAKKLGLDAISEGHETRRNIAVFLGVHENTVAKWYTERQTNSPTAQQE